MSEEEEEVFILTRGFGRFSPQSLDTFILGRVMVGSVWQSNAAPLMWLESIEERHTPSDLFQLGPTF